MRNCEGWEWESLLASSSSWGEGSLSGPINVVVVDSSNNNNSKTEIKKMYICKLINMFKWICCILKEITDRGGTLAKEQ